MPAALPPNSAYTYALVFTADEAKSAGAENVVFSTPLSLYVENFLNFPVGTAEPLGAYDPKKGVWVASDNGRVIKILSVSGGTATVDSDGNGQADNALGMSSAELQKLATLYQPGQTLWRLLIPHFDQPWDANQGRIPPADAAAPTCDLPPESPTCETVVPGSIIGCQSQRLGEVVDVVGTPFTLHYESDRVPGRAADRTLNIPLREGPVPASAKRIDVEVEIAGRFFKQSFPVSATTYPFTWDGNDSYGRTLQGSQPITARVGYVYDAQYGNVSRFGYNGNGTTITTNTARSELTLWQTHRTWTGVWDACREGLGAWTLSSHHVYDPVRKMLYLGTGERRAAENIANVLVTVAGNGGRTDFVQPGPATQRELDVPSDVFALSDGSFYFMDGDAVSRVHKVDPQGMLSNDQTLSEAIGPPYTVAPDGSLYGVKNQKLIRVDPNGSQTIIAGNGGGCTDDFGAPPNYPECGNGGAATSAALGSLISIAVAPDGTIYLLEYLGNHPLRIRQVKPDGTISTAAGTQGSGPVGLAQDGQPALNARMGGINAIAASPDGSVYWGDGSGLVWRMTTDGILHRVAGTGTVGTSGDGGPALSAKVEWVQRIIVGRNGAIYFTSSNGSDGSPSTIRAILPNGTIQRLAGAGTVGAPTGNNQPSDGQPMWAPAGLSEAPDGSLYVADSVNELIRRVQPAFPGYSATDILLPSSDASEIYRFDSNGRHLTTLNALTGAVVYQFGYDSTGILNQVTDGDANVTTIHHDGQGNPTDIVAPFGQTTTLGVDANGYLASIANPVSETNSFTYSTDGLMLTKRDPRNNLFQFHHDALGRLDLDQDPANGSQTLSRTEQIGSYDVTRQTAEGHSTLYHVERLADGGERHLDTFSDATQSELILGANASRKLTTADGMIENLTLGGDSRFGIQAPIAKGGTTTTPGGLNRSRSESRSVALSNPDNPLSLTSLTETSTLDGNTFTRVFNASPTRQFTLTSPEGRQTIEGVDSQGRVTSIQVPGIATTNLAYDSRGRLFSITQGSGADTRTTTLGYHPTTGFLQTITDPLQHVTTLGRDPAGRVTTQTLPDLRQIGFGYDPNGNMSSVTPPSQPSHGLDYTPVDLFGLYTPPAVTGSGPTQYSYNRDRQLTLVNRPDTSDVTLGYDTAGRLHTQTLLDGAITYGYEPATGRLSTITARDGGVLSFGYDGTLGLSETWAGAVAGSVSRAYDNNFRVSSVSVNGANPLALQYDRDGLLKASGALTLTPDPQNGLLTGTTLGSVADSYSYNPFGEVSTYSATANGSTIFNVAYTGRDKLGRISGKTETVGGLTDVWGYTYEPSGRLSTVTRNGQAFASYTYDDNGNRLTGPQGGQSCQYDAQDRLSNCGATSYTYTPSGELSTKSDSNGTTSYIYDALGNLQSVTFTNGAPIQYVVDGSNRRIGKKVNGALVQGFLYDGELRIVAEVDGANSVVSRFVYGAKANVPDYMIKGGQTYRIIADHLGSPRLVVNTSSGVVAQQISYDEFGNVLQDSSPGFQPFGFAGGLYDRDTGLVRFGARDYDPAVGRWTAKDPILFAGGDTNLYGYVLNDPINQVDLTGQSVCTNVCSGVGLACGVGCLAVTKGAAPVRCVIFGGVMAGICMASQCDLGPDSTDMTPAPPPAPTRPFNPLTDPFPTGHKPK